MSTNTAAEPRTIYQSCTMDFSSQVHHAMRADGVWFSRVQYRDPRYGYKWGAWRRSVAPERLSAYCGGTKKARLPRG